MKKENKIEEIEAGDLKKKDHNEPGAKEYLNDFLEKYDPDTSKAELGFLDGIILASKIYDQVLQKQLTNKNSISGKDIDKFSYLGAIDDDIHSLKYQICKQYFNDRGSQLADQFGIDLLNL